MSECISIQYKAELPDADSFFELFRTTGWSSTKQKEELFEAISNSWYSLSAYSNDRLVGFGRIISDGNLHAFIVDLIVLPEYQGQGIGKKILNDLTAEAKNKGINDIQLFCAKGKKDFYLKNNFEERPENAPGMQYRIKN
ncbi:GNAT family N-acetyltransferase [Prevotella sp. 10(H)]|uniref:GNAT family N-acetyltransferase n=1 Tax=Prevotella sp. 10(H) TaxID=1158294 RepID=UPI00068DCAFB|nr:GNAT family N-acetyltransferase [Prevotella sp. 10(H)]